MSCIPEYSTMSIKSTKEGVKTTACGQAVLLVHAQVPLAHHVRSVARLLHQLRQQFFIQRHTVGLTRPDDLVLHACVDLRRTKHLSTMCRGKKELTASVVTAMLTNGLKIDVLKMRRLCRLVPLSISIQIILLFPWKDFLNSSPIALVFKKTQPKYPLGCMSFCV